ncbi:type III toxin-antitoxin system ToxN/AbiQ family toxin [Oceanivirga miroungae]|uniref:Endoribonuclease ToxN n=1 Tax=Oceanivirga miroungae TaxID=1130046 RepID=A0A6I8MFN8_9FUSO|nr:type III toxin-antitoxin system ToxN/AbiQ family toxin [Oceanivirga miroungae]VWL85974.1 Endoribonuclease ToxN [Oceanivirga miroungae]
MTKIIDYNFYMVDINYIEYLNKIDSEVYFNNSYRSNIKPFVGIVVFIDEYHYFIPLSSAKEKHKNWKNVSKEHFLIYEIVEGNADINGISKSYSNDKRLHILSVLDIKKMIPVPEKHYKKMDFKNFKDLKYKKLLEKEYNFCLSIKDKLVDKVEEIYREQKKTGIIRLAHCNFNKLESAMKEWENLQI